MRRQESHKRDDILKMMVALTEGYEYTTVEQAGDMLHVQRIFLYVNQPDGAHFVIHFDQEGEYKNEFSEFTIMHTAILIDWYDRTGKIYRADFVWEFVNKKWVKRPEYKPRVPHASEFKPQMELTL